MKHNIPVRPKHVDDAVKHGNGELAAVDDEEEELKRLWTKRKEWSQSPTPVSQRHRRFNLMS